jgi:hypothetical protein
MEKKLAIRDEVSLKRLVLVKRLYLEGVDKANSQHNYADQMLAVINLFLAAETLMGAVILAIAQQPKQAIGTRGYTSGQPKSEQVSKFKLGDYHRFEQLYDQVVAVLRDEGKLGEDEILFKWGSLKRLQKARNNAQHGAIAPHPNHLSELATTAKDFIERVLQLFFPVHSDSLEKISLTELIEDKVLRQYLKSAETALAQERLQTCALLVRIAFLLGRRKRRYDGWRDRGGSQAIDDYDVPSKISQAWMDTGLCDKTGSEPIARLLWEIMTETRKLPRLFDNWVLGLDKVDRDRLNETTPRLVFYEEGTVSRPPSDEIVVLHILDGIISGEGNWTGPHFQDIPSANDCLWACDYVTETILRWQQEGRGRFTAVDLKYLDALPKLEAAVRCAD